MPMVSPALLWTVYTDDFAYHKLYDTKNLLYLFFCILAEVN